MNRDLDLIVHKLGGDVPKINIYPLGDIHIGSSEFDLDMWDKWKAKVIGDPYSAIVIVGDTIDNGLKNSKTNSYGATMRPREQKEWLKKELEPLKEKILGAVQGNHEFRSTNDSDDCPLYDVLCKLDKEHLYRENICFLKINLGYKNKDRQYSYTMVLAHGQGRNKTKNFGYAIDGMDVLVTGHTHSPESNFPCKIVIDSKNEVVKEVTYSHIVVPSFSRVGGYALKGMYQPQGFKIPIISLNGTAKNVKITWI